MKEIEDLTNANLDTEKILKENDHLKKLNECLERKIEFDERNHIESNLTREDITYKANSKVEQKLFETQPLQALEIDNVHLNKLFEELNDKNEILKQNNKLQEKMSFNQTKYKRVKSK
ncbi:hypothetical protein WA026_021357 [Henosepilachna vigintioctopunctata]|uniref:Uncharacterized protein n=1 Tax=Henosepilachna vigintioctopunctata TaxID=420089 RepID=A0AAW1TZH1_9CUCU